MTAFTASPKFFDLSGSTAKVQSKSGSESRIEMLDAARAIAAITIVFNHTGIEVAGIVPLASFGVTFYLMIALQMTARHAKAQSFSQWKYLAARAKRLYLPFLFWFFFPTLVLWAEALFTGHRPTSWFQKGQAYHLYFLHMLMISTVAFLGLSRMVAGRPVVRRVVIGLVVAAAIGICFVHTPASFLNRSNHIQQTILCMWGGLPGILAAIAIALAGEGANVTTRGSRLAIVGLVITFVCIGVNYWVARDGFNNEIASGGFMRALRTIAGAAFLLLALAPWRGRVLAAFGWVGRHGFGVYLAHVAILRCVIQAFSSDLQQTTFNAILVAALVFLIALGLTVLLSKTRWTAWTVGATATGTSTGRRTERSTTPRLTARIAHSILERKAHISFAA